MEQLFTQETLEGVQIRLRQVRENRRLTLLEVEKISGGGITAIALGSYERGDRQVSVSKLILIATAYEIPVTEFFTPIPEKGEMSKVSIDIRRIIHATQPLEVKVLEVIRKLTHLRGDWNGEVISLRRSDFENFAIFAGIETSEVNKILSQYSFPRSK